MAVSKYTENPTINEIPQSTEKVLSYGFRDLVKDYFLLTKPRVISLLLLTTWAAMFIAKRGWPGFTLFMATGLGLFMAAGSAHVFNNVYDRKIDLRTKRTAVRSVAAGRISVLNAVIYGSILGIGSFLLLWWQATLMSAYMGMAGLLCYVFVYTIWLKRRTWTNIVIGGAAGAFPPLVGWAAVNPQIDWLGWLLFAIIFLWTPVHFWALAILIKDDYAKNEIPMLPVMVGNRPTAVQIIAYAVLTTVASLLPLILRQGEAIAAGWIYGAAALLLNAILVLWSIKLYQEPERPRAAKLFHYSMIYLALLFVALAIDRSILM